MPPILNKVYILHMVCFSYERGGGIVTIPENLVGALRSSKIAGEKWEA